MATIDLNSDNFSDTISNNDIVIVDFWAPWCGPCKNFAPIYEKVAEEMPEVTFAKVNTEDEQEIGAQFQIRSIPTLMIFREQVIIFTQPGMMNAENLKEVITKAQALDMDEVRKQIETDAKK